MNVRSRYNARHSKRKQNIILNSLIGIVVAVILVLMANIFFSGDDAEPTAGQETTSAANESTKSASDKESTEDAVTSDEADTSDSEEENSNDEATNKEDKEKESNKEDEKDEENAEDKESEEDNSEQNTNGEVNLEGPWEPVGTTQTGDHVSDYTQGSVDWNEKLKAVETVVGYPKEEMVVHWLGGNGGPQKSIATVSQKGANDTKYEIELEWVEGKGWKAVSAREK